MQYTCGSLSHRSQGRMGWLGIWGGMVLRHVIWLSVLCLAILRKSIICSSWTRISSFVVLLCLLFSLYQNNNEHSFFFFWWVLYIICWKLQGKTMRHSSIHMLTYQKQKGKQNFPYYLIQLISFPFLSHLSLLWTFEDAAMCCYVFCILPKWNIIEWW